MDSTSSINTVLLVDDDPLMGPIFSKLLHPLGLQVSHAQNGAEAESSLDANPLAILLDLNLEGESGFDLLDQWQKIYTHIPIVVITAAGTVENAVKALQMGAVDFITKPPDPVRTSVLLKHLLNTRDLIQKVHLLESQKHRSSYHRLIGASPQMQHLYALMDTVSKTNCTVLIQGPSGSGKELVAQGIHTASPRSHESFVAINCGAISAELLESELFGHIRGAFTGADSERKGLFEQASNGTLFLDEIGEISPAMQVKLLRVLQERCFRKVGGNQDIYVETRVLAATNRDLKTEVRQGRFREDLYYRLDVVTLQVPPLHERKGDVPLLVAHFLNDIAKNHGLNPPTFKDTLKSALLRYTWPGNVRQLRNLMERLVVLYSGSEIGHEVLPVDFLPVLAEIDTSEKPSWPDNLDIELAQAAEAQGGFSSGNPQLQDRWPQNWPVVPLEELKRQAMLHALEKADWDVALAASWLGLSRSTLYRQIHEQQLMPPK